MKLSPPHFPPRRRRVAGAALARRASPRRRAGGRGAAARGAWSASARRWGCTRRTSSRRRPARTTSSSPYLEVLKDFRDDFTVISGLSHPDVGPSHDSNFSFLTARPAPGAAGRLPQQHLARSVRGRAHRRPDALPQPGAVGRGLRPVVDPQRRAGAGGDLAVERVRQAVPRRPARRGRGAGAPARRTARASSTRSASRRRTLQSGLGAGDRDKLDEYFTSVRELEQRLAQAEEWAKKPKPKVDAKPPQNVAERGRPHRQDAAAVRPHPPGPADRFDAAGHAACCWARAACRRSRACRSAITTCRTTARTRARSSSSRSSRWRR